MRAREMNSSDSFLKPTTLENNSADQNCPTGTSSPSKSFYASFISSPLPLIKNSAWPARNTPEIMDSRRSRRRKKKKRKRLSCILSVEMKSRASWKMDRYQRSGISSQISAWFFSLSLLSDRLANKTCAKIDELVSVDELRGKGGGSILFGRIGPTDRSELWPNESTTGISLGSAAKISKDYVLVE